MDTAKPEALVKLNFNKNVVAWAELKKIKFKPALGIV